MATFAIISDLHSNLEAVFARIQELGVEDVVCLGDVVGYGADPLPVTLMVMKRCKWTIQGNHDWGMFHNMERPKYRLLDDEDQLDRDEQRKSHYRPDHWIANQ